MPTTHLHFCRWLAENDDDAHGEQPGPLTFAQRRVYGRYIAELITPHLGPPGKPGRLRVIYGEGRSIATTPTSVAIGIDDGRSISGDLAVLATGHEETAKAGPACYVNPWESPSDSGVDPDAAVLIRGTGLTMVDFVVSLRASGHRGPIYAMSRRGLLPQAHRPVSALTLKRESIPFGASLVTLWRWLRRLAEDTVARGGDWRSVVDGIRPYTWEIWRRLPFNSKQRFLRHARAWWEVHRHRMAPEVEQLIQEALASGQLRIIAAKTLALVPSASARPHHLSPARKRRERDIGCGQSGGMHRRLHRSAGDDQSASEATDCAKTGAARSARHRHRRRCRLRHRRPSGARLAGALRRRPSDPRRLLGDHGRSRHPRAMRRACRPFARAAGRTTGAGKAQGHRRSGMILACAPQNQRSLQSRLNR